MRTVLAILCDILRLSSRSDQIHLRYVTRTAIDHEIVKKNSNYLDRKMIFWPTFQNG